MGRLIDQIGARTTLAAVAGALGVCVLLMSQAWNEPSLFIRWTLVRGLGQGALSVVSIALGGKWFKQRVGPAMGVFTVLLAFGFVGPIFAVGTAVQQVGWRAAWAWVGYTLLLGLIPLGWLLARSSPESCGLRPDEAGPDPPPRCRRSRCGPRRDPGRRASALGAGIRDRSARARRLPGVRGADDPVLLRIRGGGSGPRCPCRWRSKV